MNLYGLFILDVNIKYIVFSILYRHINFPMAYKELKVRVKLVLLCKASLIPRPPAPFPNGRGLGTRLRLCLCTELANKHHCFYYWTAVFISVHIAINVCLEYINSSQR